MLSYVVKKKTVITILHVGITKKWHINQLDVQNAFLRRELKQTVYKTQLPWFKVPNKHDFV